MGTTLTASPAPLKVAYVIPTLDQSGAERQLALLATGLNRSEFSPHVFVLNRKGPYAALLEEAGIPVTLIGKRYRLDLLSLWRLRQALHACRPDVIHSWLFSANTSVRIPSIAPRTAAIVIGERCVDSWKSRWQLSVDRWLSSRTNAMTANSRAVAQFYHRVGIPSDHLTVIPNAVNVPTPLPDHRRDQLRRELGIPADCFVLGFIGRLAPQKRVRDLLWGFQLIRQACPPCRLLIVGDGPEREKLQGLAREFGCHDQTIFTGHRTDAADLLQTMDTFVLPSEFEGMSNSLAEAMAAGVPVLASRIPANRALVTDKKTGRTYPTGKTAPMVHAMREMIEDPTSRETMAAAARAYITTTFSLQAMVNAHEDLYRTLVSAASTSVGLPNSMAFHPETELQADQNPQTASDSETTDPTEPEEN